MEKLLLTILSLLLFGSTYAQKNTDCDVWLELMQEELQKGERDEAAKMMNWYISCVAEHLDSKDSRLRRLLKISYIKKFEGDYAFCYLRNGKIGIIKKDLSEMKELPYDFYGYSENGITPALSSGDYVVLLDQKGNVQQTTRYDFYHVGFFGGRLAVRKGDKWGLIDQNLNEVVPLLYDDLLPRQKGKYWITALGNKKGLMSRNGKEILPNKYDFVDFTSKGLIRVNLDGKWGVLDTLKNIIIPFKYDLIWGSSRGYKVEIDKKQGYIDYNGKEIIPIQYQSAYETEDGRIKVKLNDKYGFIDWSGREIIPIKYDRIEELRGNFLKVTLNRRMGVIDKEGREMIPPIHEWVWMDSEGFTRYGPLVGKMELIDSTGLKVLDKKYRDIYDFEGGVAMVKSADNKYGYVDKNGVEIVPPIYVKAESFSEGLAITGIKGPEIVMGYEIYYGYINQEGKEVIPHRYLIAKKFDGGVAIVLESWGKDGWKLIDKRGNILTDSGYDNIGYHRFGLLPVQKGDKWGYIDTQGNLVIRLQYDEASSFLQEGIAKVTVDNKAFYINRKGECMLDCENAPANHP